MTAPRPSQDELMRIVEPLQAGDLSLALAIAEQQLTTYPDFPITLNLLGLINKESGDLDQAAEALRRAVTLRPDYAEAQNNLGIVLSDLGDQLEAAKCYRAALSTNPDYVDALSNLGTLLVDMGQVEDAQMAYNKALSLEPDHVDALGNLGFMQLLMGEKESARNTLERVVELDPDFGKAYQRLSTVKTFGPNDPLIAQMESALGRASGDQVMWLSFALAKAHDDLQDYDTAFRYFEKANTCGGASNPFDLQGTKEFFSGIISDFSAPIQPVTVDGVECTPIFILGMPRSGTTLVEQILSSHSQVSALGEFDGMSAGVLLGEGQFETVREQYLERVPQAAKALKFITDKDPLNFRWIGHILTAFPEAKIVHCARDARAVGWSIYRSGFVSPYTNFRFRLEDIAAYMGLYYEMMAFWHERFPGRIYDLDYKALTEDQDGQSRALLDHVGLDWEDGVLAFSENKRLVETVSTIQVREGMYKGSDEAWRHYEAHLGPLLDGLAKASSGQAGH